MVKINSKRRRHAPGLMWFIPTVICCAFGMFGLFIIVMNNMAHELPGDGTDYLRQIPPVLSQNLPDDPEMLQLQQRMQQQRMQLQQRMQQGKVGALSPHRVLERGMPYLIYGTAWKKEQTARLVSEAIHAGFRFIDTAGQPRHYNEAGVGDGWVRAADDLGLARSDLFIQTKYSPKGGQDPSNMPYDPNAPIEEQVKQSVQNSLKNLRTDYIDSLVLHSPLRTLEETMQAWQAMEAHVDAGVVRRLGISNCYDVHFFEHLFQQARIKPFALQNRFYAESNFDTELRDYCRHNNVTYQSFWTLTANRHALQQNPTIAKMAAIRGLTPQTLMYAFMMTLGHTPLSGSTNPSHMAQDVAITERIQGGEKIFDNQEDLIEMAKILGIPSL